MAPLADFLLSALPLKSLGVPYHLTHYVQGETPFSTPQEVFPALAAYLVIIFGIQAWMKDRPPFKLQFLFRLHNAFLTSGSLLLVLLIMEEVVPLVYQHGVFWGLCDVKMWSEVSVALLASSRTRIYAHTEARILLHDQLLLQIHRAHRYGLPCSQEEAPRYVTRLDCGNNVLIIL